MDEDDVQECVDNVMKIVREEDAFNTSIASKSDTRSYLQGIIDECQSEMEALGVEDEDGDDE